MGLTNMYNVTDASKTNVLTSVYHADCYGLFSDPQSAHGIFSGGDNLGREGEGVLNGQGGYFNAIDQGIIETSQLLDLDNNGTLTDPGWISLFNFQMDDDDHLLNDLNGDYHFTSGSNGYYDITNTDNVTRNASEFLKFGFRCDDLSDCTTFNWTLITNDDIVQDAQDFLKNRSTFDMLTFIFKIGNQWAVYNFDFNTIFMNEFIDGNVISDPFETAFGFEGTFTSADFDGKGVSHFGVFARDPIVASSSTPVPAPATLAILGLGLLVLRVFRR